jgi:ankyrin repeat protein
MTNWTRTWCNAAVLLPLALNAAAQPRDLAGLIQSGNRHAALERIRAGADVNAAQPDGTRPLHWAVFRVDHELVEELLARHAQVNVRNEFGSWPLAEAAKVGEARLVRMLLDAGADPEAPNADGQTALMLAIKGGFLPVVEMLLDAGAKVNVVEQFQRQTPLMWAAAAAHNAAPMVRLLLDRGADVRPRSRFRDWESQISSEPRAQYRPTGGHTALLYAARNGCTECVAVLLDAGADIDQPTPEGVTALMLAIDNGYNETARLLLDRGANPHLWDWWGRTALYIAVDRRAAAAGRDGRAGQEALHLIEALLDKGVDVNPQLNMHRPSRGGNSGRFSETQLSTGCTPLLRAALASDLEVMRLLLARGANPNINAMGVTAFLVAAGVGAGRGGAGEANLALLELMFQNGAEVNTQVSGTTTYTLRVSRSPATNEGMTALHAAAQRGRTELVKYLLEKGANPRIRDANGRTPLDLVGGGPAPAVGGPRGAPAAGNLAELRALLEVAVKPAEPDGAASRLSR